MIVSQRCLWAAATTLILSLSRGQVDAHHGHPRQDTPSTPTPTSSPTTSGGGDVATAPPTYFGTEWHALDGQFALNSRFNVSYEIITSPNPTQGNLSLNLLWTSATSGTPDSTNTYGVIYSVRYDCNTMRVGDSTCSYIQGNMGSASLNVTSSQAEPFPSTTDGIVKNFFFCFGINFDPQHLPFFCESYSRFFDLNVTEKTAQQQKRADEHLQPSMTIPNTVMAVTLNTAFVVQAGSAVTPGLNPLIPAVTSSSETSSFKTTSIPPTGTTTETTTTVQPSETGATDPASVAGSKSSNGRLSTGAIVGIAIGGFFVLSFALFVAFFYYRRNRDRTRRTPEQVLLTHNMHNGSRDLMAEKSEAEGPMLGSILETRRSSGPYDHLASPVGSDRLPQLPEEAPVPQRHPTSATMNTVHTEVSNISRGISDASGPISPRSATMRGDFEEPYQDIPRYGDTRHIPQIYQGALQAPFLSEPGMTDEELTRLEEEERRIDAAILAAEARRS